jgi:hypothetical protein
VFSSILAFSNIYINIFLWDQEKNLTDIGVYNAAVFGFLFAGTFMGNYIMRWVNSQLTFILSSVILTGVFALLIVQGDKIVHNIVLLGAMYGTAMGLYYAGFNLSTLLITTSTNRQMFVGMEQMTNRLTSLVTPVFFSYVIARYDYEQTFRLILAMLFIQVILSFFSPRHKSNFTLSSLHYREVWKGYRWVLISIVAFGFFQSIPQLASSVLLFQFIQKETVIGWFNTLFAVIGMLTLIVLSHRYMARNQMKMVLIGAVMATIMTALLFFSNLSTLIGANILAAIAVPFIWVPVSTIQYGKIKELSCESEFDCDVGLTAHYLLIRELMLNVGRTLFYILLIIGLDFQHSLHYFPVIAVTMLIPVAVYFFNKSLFQERKF